MKRNVLFLLMVLAVTLVACGDSPPAIQQEVTVQEQPVNDTTVQEQVEDEATYIVFWHSMTGAAGYALDSLAAQFNASQDRFVVQADFQGSYIESLATFHAVAGSDAAPTLIQVHEIGTLGMIESGHITPVQYFVDRDNYDLSVLNQTVVSYYTINGILYSAPFNSSAPMMFFNRDAFRAAGLDPYMIEPTFEDIEAAAQAIADANLNGMRGFTMQAWSWQFEQLMANQGALFMNNNNGRTDIPTEVGFETYQIERVLNWIGRMVDDGHFVNLGVTLSDVLLGFLSEDVAIVMASSGVLGQFVAAVDFEVGASFLPHPQDVGRQGIVPGGASLWIVDGSTDEEKEGAWQFIQFVQTAESQAYWHVHTGFLAIHEDSINLPIVQEFHEISPQFVVAAQQLDTTIPSFATGGALMDMIPEARGIVTHNIEMVVLNGTAAVEDAVQNIIEGVNQAIATSNMARGN